MNERIDSCAGFRDALMDVVDGTLSPAARESARAHERTCADCAELARTVREQSAILSRVRRPAPPADLGARIERALGARVTVQRPRRRMGWTAAAAAVLVAAIALVTAPTGPKAARSVQVVDIELPVRNAAFLRRVSPNFENPSASLLDPLVANENP